MTDQTKCPHCGADERIRAGTTNVGFQCGSVAIAGNTLQSIDCVRAERDRFKELLKETATSLREILEIVEQSPTSQGQFWEFCRKTQFAQEVLTKLEKVK